MAVMRACVDNVTLDSSPGRDTVVTMRKHKRVVQGRPLRQFRAASPRWGGLAIGNVLVDELREGGDRQC